MDATDSAVAALSDRVRSAAAQREPLQIRGGGTKAFYGEPPRGTPLDVGHWQGIVDYEPTELFVTARCGTRLADLEATLARSGQMLGFEPPHFGAAATVGGCVAAGLAGPARIAPGGGAVRDFVLGATLLDGRGQVLRFGGSVMKNVAGYDVARALAGSLGILGVLLDVTLKVVPLPRAEATLRFECDEAAMLRRVNAWAGQPLPISATSWRGGLLALRLSGARAAVDEARGLLGGEPVDPDAAQAFWHGVREHADPFFGAAVDDLPLWRLGLPSTAAPLAVASGSAAALGGPPVDQLIEWNGAQRWLRTAAPAAIMRARAAERGGHATLFRAPVGGGRGRAQQGDGQPAAADKVNDGNGGNANDGSDGGAAVDVFAPLAAPLAAIHRRLKDAFDPARIFNPGRMYPDL